MKTVITNGIIVTMNRDMDMYPEGYVIVEDNRISEVGPMERWRTGSQSGKAAGRRAFPSWTQDMALSCLAW